MIDKKVGILSFQELIDALEHIEVDQLHSDIPENIRAELAHMKSNLTAILSFLGHCEKLDPPTDPQLSIAISTVRRECMCLNLTISKLRLLLFFRLDRIAYAQFPALAAAQYEKMAQAVCQLCQISAPQFSEQLVIAL